MRGRFAGVGFRSRGDGWIPLLPRGGARYAALSHPELLERVSLPLRLPEQRDEVDAVALRLKVGHQTSRLLHQLGGCCS